MLKNSLNTYLKRVLNFKVKRSKEENIYDYIVYKLKTKLCEDISKFIDLLKEGYYYDYEGLGKSILNIVFKIPKIFINDIINIYKKDKQIFDFNEIKTISNEDLNKFSTELIEGIIENAKNLKLNFDNKLKLKNTIFNFEKKIEYLIRKNTRKYVRINLESIIYDKVVENKDDNINLRDYLLEKNYIKKLRNILIPKQKN